MVVAPARSAAVAVVVAAEAAAGDDAAASGERDEDGDERAAHAGSVSLNAVSPGRERDGQLAVHALGQLARDREAEAGAARAVGAR